MGEAQVVTINTAYKMSGEYDLIIVDEAHRSLSPTYRNFYKNNKSTYLLLLTATLPPKEENRKFMLGIAPIIKQKSVAEALDDGAISDFMIFNIPVGQDKSTSSKYKLFTAKLKEAAVRLSQLKRKHNLKGDTPFDLASLNRNHPDKEVSSAAKAFWSAMTMRRQSLYENSEKIKAVLQIISKIKGKK